MRRLILATLLLSTPLLHTDQAFGYIRSLSGGTPVPLTRVDNTGIQFYLNDTIVAGRQSSASGKSVTVIATDSDPVAAARAALVTWNTAGANVKFLPLKTTSAGIKSDDYQMTIAIAEDADSVSAVGGALAVTLSFSAPSPVNLVNGQLQACSSNCAYPAGGITDSDILLNPGISFSTTGSTESDFQAVLTHELGHSLSANHSSLLGATMYPYSLAGTRNVWRNLSSDDVAFVNSAYPLAGAAALGTISGTVTVSGIPAPYALLTMIDTSAGATLNAMTDAIGAFAVQAPAGTYLVYAEPFNAFVQAGNFKLTVAQAAAASSFQTTFLGGNTSPTALSVTAGNTATATITAASGSTAFRLQFAGFGGAGKSGDIATVSGVNGPILLPSGQPIDIGFLGTGFDATLTDANIRVYGKGISVRAGSVRVDTKENFSSGPLVRATLDIAAASDVSLGTIFITKGADALPLSGVLVIVPPTPTFVSKGVISAASFLGSANGDGAVSPGGIYSVYDLPNVPNLGPGAFVQNGPYDSYGNLATTLGGVSVTFDGVPAPLFLSFGGQLNFQVPFEIAGKTSTKVVVNYLGSASAAVSVPVLPIQPAFFTSDGKAVRAINKADSTINSAQNPAPRGTFIEIYGTGAGKVVYPIATGAGAPVFPGGYTGNYTFSIGGSAAAPAYFGGWTPGASGLAQWDLLIPDNAPAGAVSVAVTDTATGATSQPGTTIFVK